MSVMETLLAGSAPAFKFEKVGDEIAGVLVELDMRQDSKYLAEDPSQALKWWNRPEGPDRNDPKDRPVMIPIFTLQTDIRDSEEDDGLRTIWARGHMIIAIRAAIKAAYGSTKPNDAAVVGGVLRVKHHDLGPKKPKLNQAKLFRAKFEKKQVTAAMEQQAAAVAAAATHDESNPPPTDENW